MQYRSLSQVRNDLDNGNLTLPELVRHYLKNIELNINLNAFLSVYGDAALQDSEKIQAKLTDGKAGRLAGLVLGVKDVLCIKDCPLQASSRILDSFHSQFTATAIQRLLDEDAIIIGRLNCDEFAMGSSNENSAFGPVLNPLDNERVPGGSSGGSAVAVASDCCLAALGTDTGGSVRQPAAFCDIIGLKPTYSRISRYGLASYASSFDIIGILSKSVEDAALLLEIMAGYDEMDSTSSNEPVLSYTELAGKHENLKIGMLNYSGDEGIDPEILQYIRSISIELKKLGHEVEEIDFPEMEYALPTYYILTTAEASSNLSRYDGVRYGYRSTNGHDLESMYKKSRSEGFGEEVRRRILLGTFVLSANYYDAYYTKAQKVRRLLQDKTRNLFDKYDFVILPTTPTPPFKFGENATPLQMFLADLFTVLASVAGIPAISLPLGKTSEGLPIGVQVMSDAFTEDKLLSFSDYLMKETLTTKP